MKKLLSIILMLMLIIGIVPLSPILVSAEETDGYYNYTVTNGEAEIIGCTSAVRGDVEIPATLGGYPVTSIGENAFFYCERIDSVIIPNGVKAIGDGAFHDCSYLTSVSLPNSITSISADVFRDCYRLSSITIPNGVISIGSNAFYNCNKLISLTIPDSVTSIGSGAFSNCSSLTKINIPNGITLIDSSTFKWLFVNSWGKELK